ncbi:MAG: type II secretion system secretin GspD [Thermodesulfobacteriota bacterium]|nr:type II secretion system secretin GspD [Thermodesulfobacteriota bacterium]
MNRLKIILAVILVMLFASDNIWGVRLIDGQKPQAKTKIESQGRQVGKPGPGGDLAPAKEADTKQYVTMDFDGVDIKVFIKFIADVTGRNFIIDDHVSGKVSVISPRKMTLDQAYQVFLSVLEVNGYATVPSGNATKVVKARDAVTKSLDVQMGESVTPDDRMITRIIPLEYAEASDMKTLLSSLMSKSSSSMLAYPQSNVLIITDIASNIKKIMDILDTIDVKGFAQDVRIFPLSYASASNLGSKLTQILEQSSPQSTRTRRVSRNTLSSRAQIKIIPDERINSIIVMACEQEMKDVASLIEKMDIPTPTGKEDVHVYYLEYARAEDLAKVLTDFPTVETQEAQKIKTKIPTTSSSKTKFKVSPDKDTNSLIIYADPYTYKNVVDTIKHLDIPRKQVYVKALIMEVKTDKDFKIGVQWTAFEDFKYDRHSNGTNKVGGVFATSPGGFTSMSNLPSGALLGVVGQAITLGDGDSAITFPNMTSFINAMQTDTDVNILSTPQIITMDNKEAKIVVGSNVPYVTKEDTDVDSGNVVRIYDYRDVGVTLKLTPQINQEGNICMNMFQEITTLVEGHGEQEYAPTTLKRSAETIVTVKDGSTMVIGGLIGETLTLGETGVPFLRRIPVLGWLFKSKTKKREKTNLYIFLSPTIIDTQAKVNALYHEKYGEAEDISRDMKKEISRETKKEKDRDEDPES